MRRRAPIVWAVLSALLLFTICLPLDHVCLESGPDRWLSAALHGTARDLFPQTLRLGQQGSIPAQKDALCAACLWSQNILSNHLTVGLAVARVVLPAPARLPAPAITHLDFFQSAAKRGPPFRSAV